MKTEAEFKKELKRIMRRSRRKLMPQRIASKMGIRACEYFSYESGDIPIPPYKLYLFIKYSWMTIDDLHKLFE